MTNADGTVPVHIVAAVGTIDIAEALELASAAATASQCLVVAGIVRIPSRQPRQPGGWQFSLSHWGHSPVVVSRHRLRSDAEEQVVRVTRARGERDLRDEDAFAALTQELGMFGDGEGV